MKHIVLLILFLLCLFKANADRIASGIIQTKNGNPIVGVNVCVLGTNICTISNLNGRFEFTIPEQYNRLQITGNGIHDTEVTIPPKGNVDRIITVKKSKNQITGDPKSSFYVAALLDVPMGFGGEVGWLDKIGVYIRYHFIPTFNEYYNYSYDGIHLRDYKNRHFVGLGVPIRTLNFGRKNRGAIYTSFNGGVQTNNTNIFYTGMSEIFDFGWYNIGINIGYASILDYYIFHNWNGYESRRYLLEPHQGMYFGFSTGFNF